MDFNALIRALGQHVQQLRTQVSSPEAARNAFIMPFIKELGYDIFNPMEVVPGLVTDAGSKKGRTSGYTIIKDGVTLMLIECKPPATPLPATSAPQLLRRFPTAAPFFIRTNGSTYQFYSDLFASAGRKETPFLSFDITDIPDVQIKELKKFHKAYFDLDHIVHTTSNELHTHALMELIHRELHNPSPQLIRHFAHQVYSGTVTPEVLRQFSALTRKSFRQYLNDLITARFQAMPCKEAAIPGNITAGIHTVQEDKKHFTTSDELEGFTIVRSMLRHAVTVGRISCLDTPSYLTILLDNKEHKTICRLYLKSSNKYLGLFVDQKKEVKIELLFLDDLFLHGNALLKTLRQLDNRSVSTEEMFN